MSIAKMKEVTICALLKDKSRVFKKMQDIGLLHIKPFLKNSVNLTDKIQKIKRKLLKIQKIEPIVNLIKDEKKNTICYRNKEIWTYIDQFIDLNQEKKVKNYEISIIDNKISNLKPWGNFCFKQIEDLQRFNLKFLFSIFSFSEWNCLDKSNLVYKIINTSKEKLWVLIILSNKNRINCISVTLPCESLKNLMNSKKILKQQVNKIDLKIQSFLNISKSLNKLKCLVVDELNCVFAEESILLYGPVFFIRGFVPEKKCIFFKKEISCLNLVFLCKNPKGEKIPVKLENGWFFNSFEVILTSFTGISYYEKDITWSIGLLFIGFSSLCLLDGGYSVLLILTGCIVYKKKFHLIGKVFIITGFFSFFIGALSGQFFGLVVGEHIFKQVTPVIPLSSSPMFCFIFSLCIGTFVMLFSNILSIWQSGFKTTSTGNLFFIFSLIFFVFGNLLSKIICDFLLKINVNYVQDLDIVFYFNLLGLIFIVLTLLSWINFPENVFGKQAKLPNICWTIYSGTTGVIQDILSHMRLFGIALSGAILAFVVNKISMMMPFMFVTVCFAFVAHIAVYLMALMSMYVHTNRLIFLEFGKNCLSGGNVYYTPLSRSLLK